MNTRPLLLTVLTAACNYGDFSGSPYFDPAADPGGEPTGPEPTYEGTDPKIADEPTDSDPADEPTDSDPLDGRDPFGYATDEEMAAFRKAEKSAASDLDTLRELDAFEVGELVVDTETSGFCYGPCLGEVLSFLEQAERLGHLAEAAQDALDASQATTVEDVDEALATLADLDIIEVGALIVEEAAPDPFCYNLPCPDEVDRVEAANDAREARVVALADGAAGL